MKILLIYPHFLDERIQAEDVSFVPMGTYYVGAVLRENGYDVEILNWHNIHKEPHIVQDTLSLKKPDIIGFSIVHANRWGGIEIARIAKQLDPLVKIIFGGIGASFLWEHLLTHFKEIDYAVIGEGEYTFLNLVRSIEQKKDAQIKEIKGMAFRNEGKIVKTESAGSVRDLDKLPIPAKFFKYQHVSLTRGCPADCTFCGSPQFWHHKVRFHSPEYFVRQLELLYKNGITFFYFSDDTFTLKPDLVIRVCKAILKRDLQISWAAISGVKYVHEEALYWMRKAGCTQISYGVESGSEKIRKSLNKNLKEEQIKRAFQLTTKYGVLARAYFIYGSPGETWKTIQETIDLIQDIRPLSIIFYILDIFPGTALYSEFKRRTHSTDDIWLKRVEDIMYFETDPDLTQDHILSFGKKLRSAFYENLPHFVEEVELLDREDLHMLHADFFSRLGMTFSHGDYADIDAIKNKEGLAESLFERALHYHSDHRAYLGLGMIRQEQKAYGESMRILEEGLRHYPDSEALNMCMGINYMNKREYDRALSFLKPLQHSKEGLYYLAECYNAMGRFEKAADYRKKYDGILDLSLP